jgi:superfamily II DNA/RNA helicase
LSLYSRIKNNLSFSHFNFDPLLQKGLDAMGFQNPTPVQEQAIPIILAGQDLIACAQTGTGKTAAYVLPVLNRIAQLKHSHLNTLIIAPTRELAQQIDQQIEGFSYFLPVSSISIYGGGDGAAWEQQKSALLKGADIIIATPGRLISLLGSGDVDLSQLQHLILDEADRMLDMGFSEDITKIIQMLPSKKQTLLFSATMPPKIRTLANKILNHPKEVSIAVSRPADKVRQEFYFVTDEQKIPMTIAVLKNPEYETAIIFTSTKEKAKQVNTTLRKVGVNSHAFHSDLEQNIREEILRDFKSKKIKILVGTDVLSRGIDVDGISLVLNYDVPPDPEDYVHRIGRTARAEESGVAISLVNGRDLGRYKLIEKLLGHEMPPLPLPEHIGISPELKMIQRSGKNRRKPKPKTNNSKK